MSHVTALMRYPLKSARCEHLSAAVLEGTGVRGDRSWACVDPGDGTVGSVKHPRRWGRLLEVAASYRDCDDPHDDTVLLTVGATRAAAGTPEADAALSSLLGRPVRVTADVPADARLHRLLPDQPGLVPDWMAEAAPGEELVTRIAGARPGGRFVDYGAVHLLTTGALYDLARRRGGPVDPLRFRPNVVLDAPADPPPGTVLRIGDAVLRVILPTPRCVVPGLRHDRDSNADPTLLGVLARSHRVEVGGLGRAACFGVYAEILQPGEIDVGQPVREVTP